VVVVPDLLRILYKPTLQTIRQLNCGQTDEDVYLFSEVWTYFFEDFFADFSAFLEDFLEDLLH
jgi:hypothetical protein